MDNGLARHRAPHPQLVNVLRRRRSGYEPSDTETDWQDSPICDQNHKNGAFGPESPIQLDFPRNISSLKHNRRFDDHSPKDSVTSPPRRAHSSKSPCKARTDDGTAASMPNQRNISPLVRPESRRQISPFKAQRDDGGPASPTSSQKNPNILLQSKSVRQISPYKARGEAGAVSPKSSQRNVSPLLKSDHRRQFSPYKSGGKEHDMHDNGETLSSNRRKNERTPSREERSSHSKFDEDSRLSERTSSSRRMTSAPRSRARDKEQENRQGEQKGGTRSLNHRQREKEFSHGKAPSVGELNEMVANNKLSKGSMFDARRFDSTGSISPGDIFFSVDQTALAKQKNEVLTNDTDVSNLYPRPAMFPHTDSVQLQRNKVNGNSNYSSQRSSTTSYSSRMTKASVSTVSRQSTIKHSSDSSMISDTSGRSRNLKKFTENRKKSQVEGWFSCMRKGPCNNTSRSPEKHQLDEATFIEKAFVVESLRQFWADKYQPGSLNGFTCHKHEAQILSQLVSDIEVSHDSIPHILLKGPSGSGKKSLALALISEIFGDSCCNKSHDLRYFQVQEQRAAAAQVAVPITSSAHHFELNVNAEPNARYALMALVKEISNTFAITPEVSNANLKPDYKVIVLYEVDKAAENTLHLIKWIMDCYTDACKLILCCEDDADILETVKNRCKVMKVDAPVTHEIMEVLIQIARKEEFDLPMNFAANIAAKSKQNLRKAIMALEACKAHNYPFAEDQPIPFGWEEVLIELAAEILTDPSPNKLFFIRGKFQKLLVDFVHPKLILLKLVELFLKRMEANSKRELYYWHAYYDKRLPAGTTALLKLEEFVAKFMSMHRKSCGRQYV